MHTTRIAAAALATTALVAGVSGSAFAGHHTGDGSAAPASHRAHPLTVQPNNVSASHVLKRTFFSQGSQGGTTVASGFQTVDPVTTIKCSQACYIDGDENVQHQSSVSNNLTALTIRVDGVDQTAPYVGPAPTTFGASVWHTVSGQLAAGTHTVQTVIYTDQGTTLYNYSNVYHVFTP